jgi:hypothetical protein
LETRLTQDGEEDVDEEIGAATTLEEDTHGREDDGKDDLADIAVENVSNCFRWYLSRSRRLDKSVLSFHRSHIFATASSADLSE